MTMRSTTALLLTVLVAGATGRCVKPPPIGYVVPGPQKKGKVVFGLQGGGGAGPLRGLAAAGGGALHLESFATRRLSFPLTLAVLGGHNLDQGYEENDIPRVWGQLRAGIRYRSGKHWFIGGGLTGGIVWRTYCPHADEFYVCSDGFRALFALDFEYGYSHRWTHTGITFAQRLTWDAILLASVHLTQELTFAFYGTSDTWAFTLSIGLGFTLLPTLPWGSAALGLVVML